MTDLTTLKIAYETETNPYLRLGKQQTYIAALEDAAGNDLGKAAGAEMTKTGPWNLARTVDNRHEPSDDPEYVSLLNAAKEAIQAVVRDAGDDSKWKTVSAKGKRFLKDPTVDTAHEFLLFSRFGVTHSAQAPVRAWLQFIRREFDKVAKAGKSQDDLIFERVLRRGFSRPDLWQYFEMVEAGASEDDILDELALNEASAHRFIDSLSQIDPAKLTGKNVMPREAPEVAEPQGKTSEMSQSHGMGMHSAAAKDSLHKGDAPARSLSADEKQKVEKWLSEHLAEWEEGGFAKTSRIADAVMEDLDMDFDDYDLGELVADMIMAAQGSTENKLAKGDAARRLALQQASPAQVIKRFASDAEARIRAAVKSGDLKGLKDPDEKAEAVKRLKRIRGTAPLQVRELGEK